MSRDVWWATGFAAAQNPSVKKKHYYGVDSS